MVPSEGMVMGVRAPGNPAAPLDCETILIHQMDDSQLMLYQILLQEDGKSIKQIPLGHIISTNRLEKVIIVSQPDSNQSLSIEYKNLIVSRSLSYRPSDMRLWLHLLKRAVKLQKAVPSRFYLNTTIIKLSGRNCVQNHNQGFQFTLPDQVKAGAHERFDKPSLIEMQA